MRRAFLIVLAAGLAAAGAVVVTNYLFLRPTGLRVAVARDTDDHKLISAAALVLSTARENIRLRVIPVNSATASAAALQAGEVDLAIVRSDIALPPNGQTLVILHHNPALLVARGDSGVTSVVDLPGKTVGIVRGTATGSGNAALFDVILGQNDVAVNAVRKVALDRAEIAEAMKAGRIDAVFVVGPTTSEAVGDVVAAASASPGGAVFVAIPEAAAMAQRSPALESIEIVRGAFGGNPARPAAPFQTLGVSSRLLAKASLRDSTAADLTRLLFTERLAIAQVAPLANQIEPPPTTKGAALPVHPGAAAYLDDDEKGFFDRYSDFIYIGAMLLSVLGSGLAALASRMNNVSHGEFDRLLERVLEVLKSARSAGFPEELDRLEQETDDILVTGLANRKIQKIDSHGMAALALALDQARHAIKERRLTVNLPPARAGGPPRLASGE